MTARDYDILCNKIIIIIMYKYNVYVERADVLVRVAAVGIP